MKLKPGLKMGLQRVATLPCLPHMDLYRNHSRQCKKEHPDLLPTEMRSYGYGDVEWVALATNLIGDRTQGGLFNCYQLDPITEDIMRTKYHKGNS
jgi:hypothetical protein